MIVWQGMTGHEKLKSCSINIPGPILPFEWYRLLLPSPGNACKMTSVRQESVITRVT